MCTKHRMKLATSMLTHSHLPISEVAYRVGYDHPAQLHGRVRPPLRGDAPQLPSRQGLNDLPRRRPLPRAGMAAGGPSRRLHKAVPWAGPTLRPRRAGGRSAKLERTGRPPIWRRSSQPAASSAHRPRLRRPKRSPQMITGHDPRSHIPTRRDRKRQCPTDRKPPPAQSASRLRHPPRIRAPHRSPPPQEQPGTSRQPALFACGRGVRRMPRRPRKQISEMRPPRYNT